MAHARIRWAAAAALAATALLTACSNSEEASTVATTTTPKVLRSTTTADRTAELASATVDGIRLTDGWVKVPPKKDRTAGYFTLRNTGATEDRLTAVVTDVAGRPELHTTQTAGSGAEKMVKVNEIPLPPNQDVALRPGGEHLMLVDLKRELAAGQKVTVELRFASGKKLSAELPVLSPDQAPRSTPGGSAEASAGNGANGHGNGH
ncbi:hypothetical protein GCM10012275_41390 [Longimycelium tulufanense]|uniref:Copper chaperone PCu(A)C n=1 Tax=Longimycelium tulufanense TaxID=907463 RepID=A0A8J3FVA7_9PSEU|nr:copper chaperone PCu(A)C [Longimycelium tulufanense]GGM66601.1 hypothetical protein GCM10012275_41390 [Longimycelium tulufanense]